MDCGSNSYQRFLRGDDGGMEEIITAYRDGLIFYLYQFVGSMEKAEELAEDTFVLLCVKKPRDQKKCSFKTWLYTIGRNLSIDYLRHSAKHQTMRLDGCDELPDEGEGPEEAYLRDERKRIVKRAMNRLKSEHRQVLWLFYFEEMSYKEISIIMKKSLHATQMLASRARDALKTELIKEGITYETD